MDFHDFPKILGKSGVYFIHPPKLCAGLAEIVTPAEGAPRGVPDAVGCALRPGCFENRGKIPVLACMDGDLVGRGSLLCYASNCG